APGADRVSAALQHRPAAPGPRPARTGTSWLPATANQPRRASDPPKTSPRWTHVRVPDRRMTCPRSYGKKQVTALIVYSSPTSKIGGIARAALVLAISDTVTSNQKSI